MKIRNGFVSNSSSSSFIIIGANADGFSEDRLDELEKKNILDRRIDIIWYESSVADRLVGLLLSDNDEYLPDGVIDSEKFNEYAQLLAEELDLDKDDIKLYYGTRPN